MKATAKQIQYLKKLTNNIYSESALQKLTVSTATTLIQIWEIYKYDEAIAPQRYDWVQQAEKKAFGTVIF